MTNILPQSVSKLIEEFSKLPGIGPKTASRLTFYLLSKSPKDVESLGEAVAGLRKNLKYCENCFNITEESRLVRYGDVYLSADGLHYSAKMYAQWVEHFFFRVWHILYPGTSAQVPILHQQTGE